ncbi:MAG: hypothetical protein IIA45_10880 [Bacteroidetes bacterium]|nr:hypothetical protein [Bacteroidota bacterium]
MKNFNKLLLITAAFVLISVNTSSTKSVHSKLQGVEVCHNGTRCIVVNINALNAHLNHGDRLGSCN